ncbi:hypothetical protein K458DRAFT_289477 [Lentithecium fluviatile CBS 122367]|uniref:DBF4-type domain-containing protein n=1 Tax=Lentithecium fluviatile CBS 122367 TaxID=1168545 RepID=A0A6G1JHH9_9PLEO|nr:hypothetical protein K458DRAFT_289477 [Lentithecium fluviatile CBS 122367]
MASRRVPLANLQNVTNSPLRATAVGGKRQRSHASEQRDLLYGQPPAKKPMIEVDDAESRRSGLVRRSGAPTTAFQRKLEAVLEEKKPAPKPVDRTQRTANEELTRIRQWQKHYSGEFPKYVFYFDSMPDDVKYRIGKQVYTLGSREAKFFSREVTHVVTGRLIPADINSGSSSTAKGTVAPAQLQLKDSKRSVFDTALQKNNNNGDILYKAKELGMKLWDVEKLQRMLDAMFNTATGEEVPRQGTRHAAAATQPRGRQADLQKLLENEKLNDRDYSVASQDLIPLRGYYVYVHDMDEATRPVMVREYSKVTKKEDGKWPQFRISGSGKCPFVEDREHIRRQQQAEQEAERSRKASAAAPRTRATTAMEEKRALGENNNLARRPSAPAPSMKAEGSKPLEAPNMIPAKRANTDGMPPMFGSAQASLRAMPRFIGGEPIASGLQQSNITSAIRSQMISSTSAAPGARAGQSKEVNQLKRKVLEKSVPSANTNSGQSSVMNDMRAALNGDFAQPTRAAKRKAQETLGYIREDTIEDERQVRKAAAIRRRRTAEKELKPGYCENCREKFNDFDEHVLSRKHRKFAVTSDNWLELDQLLAQLSRE